MVIMITSLVLALVCLGATLACLWMWRDNRQRMMGAKAIYEHIASRDDALGAHLHDMHRDLALRIQNLVDPTVDRSALN